LIGFCWDEKAAAMAEFSERSEERRNPPAAACEKFPSGNLFVGESHPGHKDSLPKEFLCTALKIVRTHFAACGGDGQPPKPERLRRELKNY